MSSTNTNMEIACTIYICTYIDHVCVCAAVLILNFVGAYGLQFK